MQNIVDSYINKKDLLRLTYNELGIQNIRTIGRAITKAAVLPLNTHIHKDCIEIVVVIRGKQSYLSDKRYNLSGGNIFISFVDQPHGSGSDPQEINEIIWFQIDMRYRPGFLGLNDDFGRILHSKLSAITSPVFKIDSESIKILKLAFCHFSKMTPDETQIGQSLFVTFLNRLIKVKPDNIREEEQFSKVFEYINNHLDETIKIYTLSKICFLSESRFKHKFTEQTGVTPTYYINFKRIEKAKAMIKSEYDNGSFSDIALTLGYNSSNYFSVIFKKFTGMTPTEYKNKKYI